MKNQNDMIIAVVAIVCGLIGAGVMFGTKPALKNSGMPTTVDLAPPQVKNAEVPMVNGVGGGSSNTPGSMAGGPGGGMGGPGGAPSAAGMSGAGDARPKAPTAAGTSAG